tara:strand:+ start:60 stop:1238 length:1179 start_codon:yes stop_codon:yes gene_type:complete
MYELPTNVTTSLEINDLGRMTDEGIYTPNQSMIKFVKTLENLDFEMLRKPQIMKIIRTLRKAGLNVSPKVTKGKKASTKADLFNMLEVLRETDQMKAKTQVLNFHPMSGNQSQITKDINRMPNLDIKKLSYWGSMGILSDTMGQVTWVNQHTEKYVKNKPDILSISMQDSSSSTIIKRVWIDSIYSDSNNVCKDNEHGRRNRKVSRGMVGNVTRQICNKNKKFISGESKKPACITPKTRDASFAPLGSDRCSTCGGLANMNVKRFGGSSVNAKFARCLVMKSNGQMVLEGAHSMTEKGHRYPKVCSVHTQKIGGRHSVKIDGYTSWYSGSFVKVLYPVNSHLGNSDWVSVWVFIMNNNGIRTPNHNPFKQDVVIENLVNKINQISSINTGAV